MAKNKHVGSSFDDFLVKEGMKEVVTAVAIKRVIAWEIAQAMKAQKLTKLELAERMGTSRTQINRILDDTNPALTLDTLTKAANALKRRVKVELVAVK